MSNSNTNNAALNDRVLQREREARKQAEKLLEDKSRELYGANQELAESLQDLKQAQAQLVQSEKMVSIGHLAAGVAHEINNPVGFIASNLTSLKDYFDDILNLIEQQTDFHKSLPANTPGLAEIIALKEKIDLNFILDDVDDLVNESIEGTQRVKTIVGGLSEFSHINSPDWVEEDINSLLEKSLTIASNELKYKAEVVKEFSSLPKIICNGGKLGQVFLNLLINAAHAIEGDKGTINLRTAHVDQSIRIEVEDSGCGIEQENLAKIFDPFFTTKEVGKGTGLGLHIANDVIRSHGGTIRAFSTVGKGTTFSICLPIEGPPDQV